jgi:hypothetical protein
MDFLVDRALPDVRAFLDGKGASRLALKWRVGLRALSILASARERLGARAAAVL